jgi:hypothetical protein
MLNVQSNQSVHNFQGWNPLYPSIVVQSAASKKEDNFDCDDNGLVAKEGSFATISKQRKNMVEILPRCASFGQPSGEVPNIGSNGYTTVG